MNETSHEIQIWLAKATQGLPSKTQQMAQTELVDHYLQALDDFLQDGQTQSEAQQAAIQRLGDPETTRRAWCQVYPSRQRYLLAILASQVFSGLIIVRALLLPFLTAHHLVGFFAFVLMLIQPPIVLYLLKTLQRDLPRPYVLEGSVRILTWATAIWCLTFLINAALDDVALPWWIVLALNAAFLGALVVVCGALIRFGLNHALASTRPRAIGKVLQGLFVSGAALIGLLVLDAILLQSQRVLDNPGLAAQLQNGVNLVGLILAALYSILCACLTWVFCRAVVSIEAVQP